MPQCQVKSLFIKLKTYMKHVNYRYLINCLVAIFVIIQSTHAQEKISPNGKFATVKGLKIYYEDTGKGTPLILLHGFTGTTSMWKDFSELARHYRTIAIDLPGHGRSHYMDTTNVYLHKKAAEYIIGLLEQLRIDTAYIMGLSSGAFITLYMASMKPLLAKKIIVISGQVYYSETTRKFITSMGPLVEDSEDLKFKSKMHGKQKAILISNQFWNFRKLYGDPSFTPDLLATIKAKALIIHSDDDPIAPVSNAWEMYQHIPKASLWIIPNGGHVPIAIPANQDDFLRRILEFLREDWVNNKQ